MSPEQARGAPIDRRTDVWSTGALLFHATAGRPPFHESSVPALLMKLVTSRPPKLVELCPDAPPHLCAAIDGALDPVLDERFQSVVDMAFALAGR